jgi:metabotropic glutamate receptor 2/3
LLGTVLWMWMEPPGIRPAYPQRDQAVLKCRMEDSSFLLSQVFNVLLIVICTVYAVKTRKIPENFNESKFIGFTMSVNINQVFFFNLKRKKKSFF